MNTRRLSLPLGISGYLKQSQLINAVLFRDALPTLSRNKRSGNMGDLILQRDSMPQVDPFLAILTRCGYGNGSLVYVHANMKKRRLRMAY
jgi:hypothetical protein